MVNLSLIPNWKHFWRFWSLRLGALGTLLTSILIAFPDVALQAWNVLPDDLKGFIPERFVPLIGVAVFVTSMLARVVKQEKLHRIEEEKQ